MEVLGSIDNVTWENLSSMTYECPEDQKTPQYERGTLSKYFCQSQILKFNFTNEKRFFYLRYTQLESSFVENKSNGISTYGIDFGGYFLEGYRELTCLVMNSYFSMHYLIFMLTPCIIL